MKFGIFYEHQLPRPWVEGAEQRLFNEALDQVELADRLGIDYAWEVEHHFLEEYSHSSAPEVFSGRLLAAYEEHSPGARHPTGDPSVQPPGAYRRGHCHARSGFQWPGGVRHRRVVGRARTRWLSHSRDRKRKIYMESYEQICNMLAMDPYPGYKGQYFEMPCRNIVPKPVQRPHPPLWVACSQRETIRMAARLGIGALTFAFVDPLEATVVGGRVLQHHQESRSVYLLDTRSIPTSAWCRASPVITTGKTAVKRGLLGFEFFGYALGSLYGFGEHKPGRTDLWEEFNRVRVPQIEKEVARLCHAARPRLVVESALRRILRAPEEVRAMRRGSGHLHSTGRNEQHEHICRIPGDLRRRGHG